MAPFLNIDCDFFYDTADDISLQPGKRIVEDTSAFAARLPMFCAHPFLCLDHHEVLSYWDSTGYHGGTCVHFDAHSDLFTDFNRAWEMPLRVRGDHVGIGDYLFHALREGLIDELIWVCPRWLDVTVERARLRHQLGEKLAGHIALVNCEDFAWNFPPPSAACVCLSPEWSRQDDLATFSALAAALGATGEARLTWERAAATRYAKLAAAIDPVAHRFTFPYLQAIARA